MNRFHGLAVVLGTLGLLALLAALLVWADTTNTKFLQSQGSCDAVCATLDYTDYSVINGACWCEREEAPGRIVRVKVDVPTTTTKEAR